MSKGYSLLQPPMTEEEKRRLLKRMKRVAGLMLFFMAMIFICSKLMENQYPFLAYVIAFSEAAIVGGLADWFAVTALFRYPAGVPLPHTAIIPNSKHRIGRALGNFIEKNFLKPELVTSRLNKLDMAADVGRWLARKKAADGLSDRLMNVLPHVVEALDDQETQGFIERIIVKQVEKVDFGNLAEVLLGDLPHTINYDALVDEIIDLASEFLDDNKHRFKDRLSARTDWWVPTFMDKRLYDSIVKALEDLIVELRDPDHERRQRMIKTLQRSLINLKNNKDFIERFNDLKSQMIQGDRLGQYIGTTWVSLKEDLRHDLASSDSVVRKRVSLALQKIGGGLQADPMIREKVNGFLQQAVIQGVLPYRSSFAQFIAQVVQDWDAGDISTRIELNVGKELQYIRINGTLVGGFVGLTVHIIWQVLLYYDVVV